MFAKGRGDEGFDLAVVVDVRVHFPSGLPGVLGGEVDGTDRTVEEGGLAGKRERKKGGKESDQRAGKEGR